MLEHDMLSCLESGIVVRRRKLLGFAVTDRLPGSVHDFPFHLVSVQARRIEHQLSQCIRTPCLARLRTLLTRIVSYE